MTPCQRCDQPIKGNVQHASTEECFKWMQATLAEVRFACLTVERGIAECQMAKHFPYRPAGGSDYCWRDGIKALTGVLVISQIVGGERKA